MQALANTAFSFAKLGRLDVQLSMALAREAEQRMCDFTPDNMADIAWAFAMMGQLHAKLFTKIARVA